MMSDQNLLDMMEMDATETVAEIPRTEKLEELSKMLDEMLKYEREILDLEERIKKANDSFNALSTLKVPDLFDELGLKKLTLKDGRVVEVKLKYTASIPADNADACFDWLRDNGFESIIKHEVKADLKKGEKEEHKELVELLTKLGVSYKDKNFVHPQTLMSFVKEQIESGTNFPQEMFKVYPLRSTKVK
jgi:hypothetical protein